MHCTLERCRTRDNTETPCRMYNDEGIKLRMRLGMCPFQREKITEKQGKVRIGQQKQKKKR